MSHLHDRDELRPSSKSRVSHQLGSTVMKYIRSQLTESSYTVRKKKGTVASHAESQYQTLPAMF